MTFGQYIAEARTKAGLSQKDLAARIKKEDGGSISPQYLNDMERDRRNPPAEFMLRQMARELGLSTAYLVYLTGVLPEALRKGTAARPDRVKAAFEAFRRELEGK